MSAITARRNPDDGLQHRPASQRVHLLCSIAGKLLAGDSWLPQGARPHTGRPSLDRYERSKGPPADGVSGAAVVPCTPRVDVPAGPSNRARIVELEQLVWEQTLALISRCTQLADLCNKHQQQKDELDLARTEIMRLKHREEEARRQAAAIELQAQARLKEMQEQLEAERGKLDGARSACTQLRKKLLDAEAKLNEAHVLVVIASERATAKEQELELASKAGDRLRAEAETRLKAHKAEVDRLRSFHLACLDELRHSGAPRSPDCRLPA